MKNTIKLMNHQFIKQALFLLVSTCLSFSAQGEVTLDGSVGPSGSLTGPDYRITENLGKRAGNNLFHSFGRFNLNAAESATFSGSAGIKNVISRVTGGQTSNIDGTLRVTIPSANLYLLNPAGVIFGEHAKLDVPGSFHVSTADYLKFQDGVRFETGVATAPQVLSTAAPEAFGFLGDNPASISLSGSMDSVLEVSQGSTISLIGGDITSENTAIVAPGGRINIASVGSAGEVFLNDSGIQTASFERMGTIHISQTPDIPRARGSSGSKVSNLDTSDDTSGKIFIRGGQMVMDNSFVSSNTKSGNGGNIRIGLTDALNISTPERTLGGPSTGSEISASTGGEGNAGNITITASTIHLHENNNDSQITSISFGDGNSGNITITTDTLEIQGETGIENSSFLHGDGGDLTIKAKNLKIFDGGELRNVNGNNGPNSTGKGGNLIVDAKNILLSGEGAEIITRAMGSGEESKGSNLRITTGRLEIRDGGEVDASTAGKGAGGNSHIEAEEILLSNTQDLTHSTGINAINRHLDGANRETGDSGNLTIKSKSLIVERGAKINTTNYGKGKSATVFIESDNILLSSAEGVVTGIIHDSFSDGQVGDLTVNSNNLQILNEASIRSLAFSSADSSNITINSKKIRISGIGNQETVFTRITTRTAEDNTGGGAGDLTITTDQLDLQGNAEISTNSSTTGSDITQAGNITITAGQINLKGNAKISASTTSQGKAGNILINVDKLVQSGATTISSQTDHVGNAGDITINAKHIKLTEGSTIKAKTTKQGRGGNLRVKANTILLSNGNSSEVTGIFTSSELAERSAGDAGDLEINANFLEVRDGALISAQTEGPGRGGDLEINANDIELNNARLSSASRFEGLDTLQNSQFLQRTDPGKSGDIKIALTGTLRIKNNGGISVSTDNANAGDIGITGGNILHLSNSFISTSVADGKGNGGNISITTPIVGLDNSVIRAQAAEGHGGNIDISGLIFQSPSSLISASSKLGADGKINLRPDTNISGSLAVLPDTFFNASQQMSERCTARSGNDIGSFVAKGRGGVPLSPGDLAPSNFTDYLQTNNYSLQNKTSDSGTHSGLEKNYQFASMSMDCIP